MSPRWRKVTDQKRGIRYKAEGLASSLPPLLIAAERVASIVSQGVHGRRRVGQGETFWQFRRYEYGDSVQLIDWRQSAKSDAVYVRETEWEAAQSVWLWRDGSPSMSFQSDRALEIKYERADLLVLALSSLLIRAGERVALLGTGMMPASDRGVLSRMWAIIEGGLGSSTSLPKLERLPRYSRVVMVGDFLSPIEEITKIVSSFAYLGIRGHLVQVLDPAEEQLPYDGRVLFEGPEAEGKVMISHVESLRNAYAIEFTNHRDKLNDLCRRFGWSVIMHRTDQPPELVLLALYMQLSETLRA